MQVMKDNHQAFTLLELLLGILIFSIIGMAVYAVFASGVLLSQRSENRGATLRDGRMALDLMARDLENMVEYNFFSDDFPGSFRGFADEIAFLLPTEKGLRWVRYVLKEPMMTRIHQTLIGSRSAQNVNMTFENHEADRLRYLIRQEFSFTETPFDVGVGNQGEREDDFHEEVILMTVKPGGLQFQFGFVEGETTLRYFWKETWENQSGIPANIRLDFVLADTREGEQDVNFSLKVLVPHGRLGSLENETEEGVF
jgi:type II secretion system protein J